ncbi:MAG: hypothetical protein M1831_003988 [Alyxoria varia]|nr:MAG: hypothetical protein M1831_003988 [Alyxoria varia]
MRVSAIGILIALACSVVFARTGNHVGRRNIPESNFAKRSVLGGSNSGQQNAGPQLQPRHVDNSHLEKRYTRPGKTVIPQNANTTKFAVDGRGLPEVDFDIGESYAGLLPISPRKSEPRKLYFWFFPSSNPLAKDEITIWLNGGPGCSSLEGLFQENGPVVWQYGTRWPNKNPWTWVNETNMVWVEQPVGTGFSQGEPTATNQEQAAQQFLGFFRQFVDTFGVHNRKIYITGESYAGYYVPYIADAMLNRHNEDYFNVEGTMIYDPSTTYESVQSDIVAYPFAKYHGSLFHIDSISNTGLEQRDRECGYSQFRDKYLTFPPPPGGHYPKPPSNSRSECRIWDNIYDTAMQFNPAFDVYQVATTPPILWDVLGFPGSFGYLPRNESIYFARPDVQRAINAPIQDWAECSNGVLEQDTSPPSGLSVLPRVIERTKRTVIGHGELDYILIANGTLLMIQNMTWSGKQGFQKAPNTPFIVPPHGNTAPETLASYGRMGTWHEERGLTWVETWLSGHMVPQYQPSAALQHIRYLLGRIDSLGE